MESSSLRISNFNPDYDNSQLIDYFDAWCKVSIRIEYKGTLLYELKNDEAMLSGEVVILANALQDLVDEHVEKKKDT